MDFETAYKIFGRQSRHMIRNTQVALSMHSFNNTPEEAQRKDAADFVLRRWNKFEEYRINMRVGSVMRDMDLRGIKLVR